MSPEAIKLAIFAMDQVTAWTVAYAQAKANPSMTPEEAEQLVRDTQAATAAISDEWRNSRSTG